ncbi:MAG: hypothetical protein IT436_13505 [Phycisphaerales bacterium]|nr:hypothetical protein [Phycisphaerales bacterium]
MPAFAQPSIDFYAPSFSVLTNFSTGATSDGKTIVGYSRTLGGEYGYRWDKATGKQWLDGTSTGRYFITGEVSDDLKVVGYRQSTEGPFQALQWTPSGGITTVVGSEPNSQALAITRDGRYIVGWQQDAAGNRRGRMWNSAGVVLGDSAWLGDSSQVVDLSDDAAVTVGFAAIEGRQEAFRRLESGEIERLGFLDPTKPTRSSRAVAVSNDGQVIVGTNRADMRSAGFLWRESGGMIPLPNDSRGYPMQPYGVSGDGSVIVGFTATPEGLNALGVLMTPDGTVWDVKTYLLSLGLPVEQYNFRSVRTVSADGLTIAGVADLVGGASDYGFVATLPAPMSCSPLVFAILANRRRR